MRGPFIGDIGHLGRWRVTQWVNPPAEGCGFREDALALQMNTAWALALLEAGEAVGVLGFSSYGWRQRAAATGKPALYVNWHVNSFSPAGDYALILGDGPGWGDIAAAIVPHLEEATGLRCLVHRAGTGGYGGEALVETIAKTGCPGLVIEPGFVNNLEHARLWQAGGPDKIGRAVAHGCLKA